MWWWIALIVYLIVGVGVSIWVRAWDDEGILGFLMCVMFMPIPATVFVIWESIKWICNNGILRLISWIKDEFKEYLNPEERKWRKWKKQYYVRQEQERRSQEAH